MAEKRHTLSDFDFHLPAHLLATEPCEKRDHSRLMVISLKDKSIQHKHFYDLPEFLNPNDLVVLNDTKVIPARMVARKESLKGALLQILILHEVKGAHPAWLMLVDPIKKVRIGTRIVFGEGNLIGVISKQISEKELVVEFPEETDALTLKLKLFELGKTPLPPYIRRPLQVADETRYQTIFAKNEGALAAPTAGLHFTPELLNQLNNKEVGLKYLTLTIGMGTFNPIYKADLDQFQIHKESFEIPEETAAAVNAIKTDAKRVLAIGTTTFRAIESATRNGKLMAGAAESELFIRPGYNFKSNASLLTNFHTPKSSLLMLISAFMGYEFTREVYRTAIEKEYRFFSYGDAMLILR